MKLMELEIHNFRGIKDLVLKPNGKSFLIYGPNGSGKSSVVDAIDFLFTGHVSRLTGEGTGEISLQEHGPHIDHSSAETNVKGLIKFSNQENSVEISRCMSNPNKLNYEENTEINLKIMAELFGKCQYILTRREILKYITATPSNRAKTIQTLLNLGEIEKIREKLIKITGIFDKEHEASKINLERAKDAINTFIQKDIYNEEDILGFVNQNRAVLRGNTISTLNWKEFKNELTEPTFIESKCINFSLIKINIQNISEIISEQNQSNISKLDTDLRNIINEFKQNRDLMRDINRLELTELGLGLIDDTGNCPLCDTVWKRNELEKKLKERIDKIKNLNVNIQKVSTSMAQIVNKAIFSIDQIKDLSNISEMKNIIPIYQSWYNNLQELRDILKNPLYKYLDSTYNHDNVSSLLAPINIRESIKTIQSIINKKGTETTPEQISWDNLTRLEEHLKTLEKTKAEFLETKISFEKVELISNSFEVAKDYVLSKLYEEIKDRFVELYKKLHGNDENDFTAKIEPAGSGLDFKVNFQGHENQPPHALHSEGHQDTMGICLYLALAERVNKDLIDLIILDDVVMSVDADHRRGICNILKECFPNKQFFLTTHDKTWTNQLKSERVVCFENIIEFYNWNIHTGPLYINYKVDMWDPIEKDLENNIIPNAAGKLRRGLEEFFGYICNELNVPVVYKLTGRYELGDFLNPAMETYREILKKAKDSAKSWENDDLCEGFKEMDSTRSQIYKRTFAEQWAIDASVHYNNWINLSINEFRPVVESFHDLCLLFLCSNCGGISYLIRKDHKPTNFRCNCGAINWNLVKKV